VHHDDRLRAGRDTVLDIGRVDADRGRLDIGEDVVAPYLWDRGLSRVDVIAATHGHEDHIGGLPALIQAFRPKELWLGGPPDGPAWRKVREAVSRSGTAIVELGAGNIVQFGGAEFRVLAAQDGNATGNAAPANNDSLVLRVAFGRHAFLLTGDIERKVEDQLVESGELTPANVLKVPHHGSRSSSSQEFLDAVGPSFAVISAGFGNSYGNPHHDVLDRIQSGGAAVFRTDHDGMVTVRSDGKRIDVETHRELAVGPQVMQPAPVFGGSW
jgi:competence protein ComEC